MARPRNGQMMTIAELEQMLERRRRKLGGLLKERNKVQKKLDDLDARIESLGGGRGAGGGARTGARARNPQSLVATLETVFRDSGKPMSIDDILDKVRAAGYRSSSENFRALVNQTLIKEKRFTSAGRGIYQLKK